MFHDKHFLTYRALLVQWQATTNLIAPSTLPDVETRHFADSAQLAPLIPTGAVVADVGSGAGFPGMVLALMRPDMTVHLIESDLKKVAFLKSVCRETLLPEPPPDPRLSGVGEKSVCPETLPPRAEGGARGGSKSVSRQTLFIHPCRVEALYATITPDVVTARAVAPLAKLCALIEPWARRNPSLVALFLKGAKTSEEIAQARKTYTFDADILPSQTDRRGHIVRLTNLCVSSQKS